MLTGSLLLCVGAWRSFKALRRAEEAEMRDVAAFWTVVAILHVMELFADWLLLWIPFYGAAKAALAVLLMVPARLPSALFDAAVDPIMSIVTRAVLPRLKVAALRVIGRAHLLLVRTACAWASDDGLQTLARCNAKMVEVSRRHVDEPQ
jgi:hypothetical protein